MKASSDAERERERERVKEFHLKEEGHIMTTFIQNWKIMKKD